MATNSSVTLRKKSSKPIVVVAQLSETRTCQHLIIKGLRRGQLCGRRLNTSDNLCALHIRNEQYRPAETFRENERIVHDLSDGTHQFSPLYIQKLMT